MSKKPTDILIALKDNLEITSEKWQKIGVSGKWEGHPAGTFEMDENTFNQMIANYKLSGIDIVCDYEHQTLFGDIAPASGWIRKTPISLKVQNGELLAKIEWTKKAQEYIKQKEYRYLSPVFAPNTISQKDGRNIGWTLHSLALTNKPFLEELDEIKANKLTKLQHQKKEKKTMTEEELKALKDERDHLKDENVALKNDNKKLQDQVAGLRDKEAEAKVDSAIAAKKLHPDQKEAALLMCKNAPDDFEKFLETAKPMVQVPSNDMFDNKNTTTPGGVDVVALAMNA